MITTVKTRKKIQKDQDQGLDQTRKREKSHVRKNEIRGKILIRKISHGKITTFPKTSN